MAKTRCEADQEVFDWVRARETDPGFPTASDWLHALRRAHGPFQDSERANERFLALLLMMSWVPLPSFVRAAIATGYRGVHDGEPENVPHLAFYTPKNFNKKRSSRRYREIPKLEAMCNRVKNGTRVTKAAEETAAEYSHKDPKAIFDIWTNPEYLSIKLGMLYPEQRPLPQNKK